MLATTSLSNPSPCQKSSASTSHPATQTLKRARRELFKKRKVEEKEYDSWHLGAAKINLKYVKDERRHRREDWIKGPLAEDRDTGTTRGRLGSVDPMLLQRRGGAGECVDKGGNGKAEMVKGRWEGLREEEGWEGEGNEGNIVVGDRVCVVNDEVEGVRGRIGVVKEVSREKGEVVVGGC